MSNYTRRSVAGLAAAAMGVAGGIVSVGAPSVAHADECTATSTVSVFTFNDFHGRIDAAAKLFTPVEERRAAIGESNVLLLSNGDNIGGSTFVSAVADDQPTIDVLNAAALDAASAGNHEFDKGWEDLAGRVVPAADFPYLAANVVDKGTNSVAVPLKAYTVIPKGGLRIAIVGAVTKDLPSLVSPAGISALDVKDPVASVNAVAKQLKDGDTSNGEADVVIATIHEGSPDGSTNFAGMYDGMDASVDAIINGHTHVPYLATTAKGQPIVQAKSYGAQLVQLDLGVTDAGALCGITTSHVAPAEKANTTFARIAEIEKSVDAAKAAAAEKGAEVVGQAEEAISTPGDGGSGTRDQESPMSNMVAQMFFDMMSNGNDEFIGVQNPGGTRTSFDQGDITYEEAALVLPFANSLMTTQLTGAQFVEVLNQQWQRDAEGNVPSRPYLALGLSDNVSYTYDESLPEGERITSVFMNGEPMDMEKLYTVGSGSFLISGGDNFRAFAKGVNTADSGLVDLTAWVDWLKEQGTVAPDYTKRGVSITGAKDLYKAGETVTLTLGAPGEVNPGTLDMFLAEGAKVSPQLANAEVHAMIGEDWVGHASVVDGVAQLDIELPADLPTGQHIVYMIVADSGTLIAYPINVEGAPAEPSPSPSAPAPSPSASASPTPQKPGLPKTGA